MGDYDSHECSVRLSDASAASDAGRWTCEVEDYVFGPIRGAVARAHLQVEISTTSATTTVTTTSTTTTRRSGHSHFAIVEHGSSPEVAREGENVILKCKTNRYFEYCTWRKGDKRQLNLYTFTSKLF